MRRGVLLLISTVLAALLAGGVAWAAAGELDPTFGGDGKVSTQPGLDCRVLDLAALPDSGKTVAFGECSGSNALVRYNPDGSLDDTFGEDGTVTFGGSDGDALRRDSFHAFVVQPDGKLVVGGRRAALNRDPEFVVARFNADGTLNTEFGGGNGKVFITFGKRHSEEVDALVMQGNRIVAAGDTGGYGEDRDVALARFRSDGKLDTNFGGGDGKVKTNVRGHDSVKDLAVDPSDGKLLVAGTGYASRHSDFSLVRFRPNGRIDRSFGNGDGKVTTDFGRDESNWVNAIVVRGNRTILAGATVKRSKDSPVRGALAAYRRDGTLARSFGGGDGKMTCTGQESKAS